MHNMGLSLLSSVKKKNSSWFYIFLSFLTSWPFRSDPEAIESTENNQETVERWSLNSVTLGSSLLFVWPRVSLWRGAGGSVSIGAVKDSDPCRIVNEPPTEITRRPIDNAQVWTRRQGFHRVLAPEKRRNQELNDNAVRLEKRQDLKVDFWL